MPSTSPSAPIPSPNPSPVVRPHSDLGIDPGRSIRARLALGFPVVGVIGGGQLARMMQPAAVALGIGLRVLAEGPAASAAQVVPDSPVGDHRDQATVAAFAADCDLITFEHEHVPAAVLEQLEADGVVVRPGPAALQFAQDKLAMRRILTDLGLPVPRWQQVHSWAQVLAFSDQLREAGDAGDTDDAGDARAEADSASGGGAGDVVLKTPRGGYDGKGVLVLDPHGTGATDVERRVTAERWLAEAGEAGLLAEQRVPFTRELAVLVARSPSGQAAAYPVVASTQVDGVCREVVAPAPGLDPDLAAEATRIGLSVAGELGVVGVLAVEMFELAGAGAGAGAMAGAGGAGRLLVNELAMRPHNCGHWTIDGAVTSQFEQHLRAVLDLPLGDPRPRSTWSVMVNVLGGDHPDLYRSYLHVMARDPGVKVHVYGKDVRQGRKVGHVTVCGDDLDDCLLRARHAADFISGVIDE